MLIRKEDGAGETENSLTIRKFHSKQYGAINYFKEDEAEGERDENSYAVSFYAFYIISVCNFLLLKGEIRYASGVSFGLTEQNIEL